MSPFRRLLNRIRGRTPQSRWDKRWAEPAFYSEFPIGELAHYSVLAGYHKRLKPGGSLLDVGCGAGVFLDHLHADSYSAYVGVDFPKAVERGQHLVGPRVSFAGSDLRDYSPTRKFDSIVFNEVLYYIDDPIAEVRRYEAFLEPSGVFLASMHRKEGSERMWERIEDSFGMIDLLTIQNRNGTGWIMGAFRPRSTS